jgi:hypothetical protein
VIILLFKGDKMGMYDEFAINNCRCKNCDSNMNDIIQTKNFECLLSIWATGDYIGENISTDLLEEAFCDACGEYNNVFIRIRNGFYVGCVLAEEDSDGGILIPNIIENINDKLFNSIKNRNRLLNNEVNELRYKIFKINKYLSYTEDEFKNNRSKLFQELIIKVDDLSSKNWVEVIKEIIKS